MSVVINGVTIEVVHLRHDGRSYEVDAGDLSLAESNSSQDLVRAVEDNLDLGEGVLTGYEVDFVESSNTAIVRPAAKFGI